MKKRLYFINSERGFFLPYVLFTITLVFIYITSNIHAYRSEIDITEGLVENIKAETLFQMGHTKIKEEMETFDHASEVFYRFPEGSVEIELKSMSEDSYQLYFTMRTNKDFVVSITNYVEKDKTD
ncbi:hypothetical protein [Virgibacillus ainsalahensis]